MRNLIEKCRRLAGNWTFNKEMTGYMAKNGKPGRSEDVDKTPLEDVSKDTVNSYPILLYYVHYCGKTSITISLISPRFSSPSPTTLRSSRMSPKITAGCHCIACCTCTWSWIVEHHFPPFSPQANHNPAYCQVPESKRPGSFLGRLVPDRSHRVRDYEACLCAYLFAGITLTIDNHNLEHQKFQNFTTCP